MEPTETTDKSVWCSRKSYIALPDYKIMSDVVFNIENMNRGLVVAWKYQTRLAEFDISMQTPTVHIFDMEHNIGDMNFFLNLYNVKTK